MKAFLLVSSLLALVSLAQAEEVVAKATPPKGPLTETERKFVGKWRGSRGDYKWEIHRKEDRTFEIAFLEPDPDRLVGTLKNYAIGVWWVDGKSYQFEWTKWWGADGDLGGLATEVVDAVEADRVVTLTDDEEEPRNVEVRTKEFTLPAWKLKPVRKEGEKPDAGAAAPDQKADSGTRP